MSSESASAAPLSLKDTRALVADLFEPRALIYWPDLLASAAVGWAAFGLACGRAPFDPIRWGLTVVAALALYRAVLFVHELTHLGKGALPGFNWVWDLLIGIPMQVPSFLYLGVHLDHHRRPLYGTAADPEYLPLGRGPRWRVLLFAIEPIIIPLLFVVRFAVLAPLSLIGGRRFRGFVVAAASGLVINPAYRRPAPSGTLRARWIATEVLTAGFAWLSLGLVFAGRLPAGVLVQWYVVSVLVAFVNQLRTLGAHRFVNAGGEIDVMSQLADSVNINDGPISALWAPVGLRFHGLHHFLPDMPYHGLAAAHRRLMETLPADSIYRRTVAPSLSNALVTLWRAAGRGGEPAHG